MGSQGNLVRKQYFITRNNIQKLEKLARDQGTSVGDIVRKAIDAYDPGSTDRRAPDLMELVSKKLKAAIAATKKTNCHVAKALISLDH